MEQTEQDLMAGAFLPLLARLPGYRRLTPTERDELLRMAQGLGCNDAAADANVSPNAVLERRRRIYMKLHIVGMGELLATLLDAALRMQARGLAGAQRHVRAAALAVDRYKGLPPDDVRARTG